MKQTLSPKEGYVYATYGSAQFLKHAAASVASLRRYDRHRPVALVCTAEHREILERFQLTRHFDRILPIRDEHASIVGFKHNLNEYMPFERNLFLDSDIIWCRKPDPLWSSLSAFSFTITGIQIADNFFGGPKDWRVVVDMLLGRRRRTLRRFGLNHLSRVQSGMIYAADSSQTKRVCDTATSILKRKQETHFRSRLSEKGRSQESCEWSLAMAMATLNLQVYPWFLGHHSPQLDFIESYTAYDPDFKRVSCTYYCNPFVYSFRGLNAGWLRKSLIHLFSLIPGKGDHLLTTPYCLHFGWVNQKQPFYDFAERTWMRLTLEAAERLDA